MTMDGSKIDLPAQYIKPEDNGPMSGSKVEAFGLEISNESFR